MGELVSAFACTHTLNPHHYPREWKQSAQKVGEGVRELGRRLRSSRPDILIIVANDHFNAFPFRAVPSICLRLGDTTQPMKEYDMLGADTYENLGPLRICDDFANRLLHKGVQQGFDVAISWEAPLDHAFLEPLKYMEMSEGELPPLVPVWINCFVSPQPSPRRCYDFGEILRQTIGEDSRRIALLATGGLSHFPGLNIDRLGEPNTEFDKDFLTHLEKGEGSWLTKFTAEQLCDAGEHELLNWAVLLGVIKKAKAEIVSYEVCQGLAGIGAVAWRV